MTLDDLVFGAAGPARIQSVTKWMRPQAGEVPDGSLPPRGSDSVLCRSPGRLQEWDQSDG